MDADCYPACNSDRTRGVTGVQIKAGTPEYSMYGFAVFYAICLVLNWWFYLRRGSEIKNP